MHALLYCLLFIHFLFFVLIFKYKAKIYIDHQDLQSIVQDLNERFVHKYDKALYTWVYIKHKHVVLLSFKHNINFSGFFSKVFEISS